MIVIEKFANAMIVGIIRDLSATSGDNAYARKVVTFPVEHGNNGSVVLIICKNGKVANAAECGIDSEFAVENATPRSEVN